MHRIPTGRVGTPDLKRAILKIDPTCETNLVHLESRERRNESEHLKPSGV
jgi:hypothetical protein